MKVIKNLSLKVENIAYTLFCKNTNIHPNTIQIQNKVKAYGNSLELSESTLSV